jgi:hypothetical protein
VFVVFVVFTTGINVRVSIKVKLKTIDSFFTHFQPYRAQLILHYRQWSEELMQVKHLVSQLLQVPSYAKYIPMPHVELLSFPGLTTIGGTISFAVIASVGVGVITEP